MSIPFRWANRPTSFLIRTRLKSVCWWCTKPQGAPPGRRKRPGGVLAPLPNVLWRLKDSTTYTLAVTRALYRPTHLYYVIADTNGRP